LKTMKFFQSKIYIKIMYVTESRKKIDFFVAFIFNTVNNEQEIIKIALKISFEQQKFKIHKEV